MGIDQSLKKGVGGQTIGPVQAGACGFSHSIKALNVRAPVKIRGDAAAHIMGGRHHRDRLFCDINAIVQTFGINIGEPFPDKSESLCVISRNTESHRFFSIHCQWPGHNVPAGQFQIR